MLKRIERVHVYKYKYQRNDDGGRLTGYVEATDIAQAVKLAIEHVGLLLTGDPNAYQPEVLGVRRAFKLTRLRNCK